MKLPLIAGIALIGLVAPAAAQQRTVVPDEESATPDTSYSVLHAERAVPHDSAGVHYTVYEGNIEATIFRFKITADRLELYSDPIRFVATGHVIVMAGGIPVQVKRFEWNWNQPKAPVVDGN
jgi:hypothetical protein